MRNPFGTASVLTSLIQGLELMTQTADAFNKKQVEFALKKADAVIFLCDGKAGLNRMTADIKLLAQVLVFIQCFAVNKRQHQNFR